MSRHRRRNRRGYFKFKAQCPECKRMVKGHLPWDEHEGEFSVSAGSAEGYGLPLFRVGEGGSLMADHAKLARLIIRYMATRTGG